MITKKKPQLAEIPLVEPDLGLLDRYKANGLELYISDGGEVYAHQSAIARMLGMQQGHLSSVLKSPILPEDKEIEQNYTLKLPTDQGLRYVTLYGVSTLIKLAERYNKKVARQFAEMGARVYLYQLAGYQVRATPVEPPQSSEDVLFQAYEAMGKLVRIRRFADDLNGLQAYLDFAEREGNQQLQGRMTLDAMATHFGYELTPAQNRQIGRSMSGAAASQMSELPSTIRKRYVDSKGNYQSFFVKEYPTKLLTLFDTLCQNGGIRRVSLPLTT